MVSLLKRPASLVVAGAMAILATGCPSAAPPARTTPSEPLVIGKSPPGPPLAIAASPSPPRDDRVAHGDAPAIWLDSLTTPGKAALPEGKVVIVAFWATWCAPCHKQFPKLQALYEKHRGRGLEIVAVSVDDEENGIADFAKAHAVRFPVAWDKGHDLAGKYKLTNMPTMFVVDRKGNIAFTHLGYHDGEEVELEQELTGLL